MNIAEMGVVAFVAVFMIGGLIFSHIELQKHVKKIPGKVINPVNDILCMKSGNLSLCAGCLTYHFRLSINNEGVW